MYTHRTQQNRIELSLLLRLGYSIRATAAVLGVSPSTVSRELKRNTSPIHNYRAHIARVTARTRRARANALRTTLLTHPRLAALVEQQLKRNDSPEQIAGWLKATRRTLSVCAQTIYDWIYTHARHLLHHLHCRKGKYRRTRQASMSPSH